MNIPKQETLRDYAPALLRFAMAGVFLWFGSSQLLNPQQWVSFLPSFVTAISPVPPSTIIILNGVFEIIFAVLLAFGVFTRIAAILLGGHLVGIALSLITSAIGIRDMGLSIATLAIALFGPDKFCMESKPKGADKFVSPIVLIVLIALVVLSQALAQASAVALPSGDGTGQLTPPPADGTSLPGDTATPGQPITLTQAEVAQHNSAQSCYIIVDGKVYDVTTFIPKHPGGPQRILANCGTDATAAFRGQHGTGGRPNQIIQSLYIGDVGTTITESAPPVTNVTVSKKDKDDDEWDDD